MTRDNLELMKIYLPYIVIMALWYMVGKKDENIKELQQKNEINAKEDRDYWREAALKTLTIYQQYNNYEKNKISHSDSVNGNAIRHPN